MYVSYLVQQIAVLKQRYFLTTFRRRSSYDQRKMFHLLHFQHVLQRLENVLHITTRQQYSTCDKLKPTYFYLFRLLLSGPTVFVCHYVQPGIIALLNLCY